MDHDDIFWCERLCRMREHVGLYGICDDDSCWCARLSSILWEGDVEQKRDWVFILGMRKHEEEEANLFVKDGPGLKFC